MKKIFKIAFLLLFTIFVCQRAAFAENEEVLQAQKESLNLSDFISEAQRYVDENLEGIDVQELINSAITGKVENENIYKSLFNILGKEVKDAIKIMRKYLNNSSNT